jgi:hypothetical protein
MVDGAGLRLWEIENNARRESRSVLGRQALRLSIYVRFCVGWMVSLTANSNRCCFSLMPLTISHTKLDNLVMPTIFDYRHAFVECLFAASHKAEGRENFANGCLTHIFTLDALPDRAIV